MPTSEPKKTATKKAAKKVPAKKKAALQKAADVAVGPTGEQVLADVHESIDRVIAEGYEAGVPVLVGGVTVSLHLEYDDATTPVDAVNQALNEIAFNGLRAFTFLVRDEVTQELYAVQNGKVVSLEEAREPYDPIDEQKHRVYEEN